ncbi:adenosylcobinamide-GDP ribazoletransferase [Shewanella livingstonensis]|uniref:Adenosylcobinamide-GDP ribazoletransferase n=1 Tax=Shewanella livingstonensis TaxID=150120 RepID=A0A3G8LX59_9GAMM|nr:adenosylcobinamide-GDP ribazoletransferase [Shewanella livingstonensis]AZG73300.1 adenosylcobinamide-GDP ribazoletransferase [Shewanella livingstonensis]
MSNNQLAPENSKVYSAWHPILILTAIGFLTRISMPKWVGFSQQDVANASRWFSLVGLLVGCFLGCCLWLLTPLFGQAIAVALTIIIGWRLTGGFHEDGLADVCDGFWGAWQRDRKLEIMKDSQIGAYGVLALIGSFSLKLLILSQLPLMLAVFGLICSHTAGRAGVGCMPALLPYARVDGPSKTPQRKLIPSNSVLVILVLIAAIPLCLFPINASFFLCCSWIIGFWLMFRLMKQHLQGYTGDTLGATEQVIEIVTLLTLVLLNNCGVL